MEKKYTTVIFDMDGTLLNTLEDIADSVNYILRKYHFPERTYEQTRASVGNGARVLMRLSLPLGEAQPQFEEILEDYENYYAAHCQIKTGAYEGIMELLKELNNRGFKMAIVSNKGDSAVKALNEQYFSEYISIAQGVCEGILRKPAPDTVLAALKSLDSTVDEAIYVGDSEVDRETSARAQMDCALCTWGFRDRDQLDALKPRIFLDHPLDLLKVL